MSALDAFEELKAFAPEREWRLILVDAGLEDVDRNRLHILGEPTPLPCFPSEACINEWLTKSTTILNLDKGRAFKDHGRSGRMEPMNPLKLPSTPK